jgi:hypothetical protein
MTRYTDRLLSAVHEIAEIIHMELDLEFQDRWLQRVIEDGLWEPEDFDGHQ